MLWVALSAFKFRFFVAKGYRDGMAGLVLSVLFAFYRFEVEAKTWEAGGYRGEWDAGIRRLIAPSACRGARRARVPAAVEAERGRAVRLREAWRRFTREQVQTFLRVGHEGREHPSRLKIVDLLAGMTSVLDVGCGTGVMFELIRERRPEVDYRGVDVTEQFVAAARTRFPADAHRFTEGSLFELDRLPGAFDAVLCRHILEHLPDWAPAVQHMYGRARRKLVIVFYL